MPELWEKIESGLCVTIPSFIRHGFELCGFSEAVVFKKVTDTEINMVELFIRNELVTLVLKQKAVALNKGEDESFVEEEDILIDKQQLIEYYGPLYAHQPENFRFQPGHRMLIKEMVSYVTANETVTNSGAHKSGPNNFESSVEHDSLKQDDEKNTTRAHFFLKKLTSMADQNANHKKGGYRYDKDIQLFSTYLRLIVGKMGYETLHANLEAAIPSLPTIDRYIRSSHFNITPGVLRSEELLQYLSERSLPRVVSISEDMTRIVGRVQYDSRSNQLYGFVEPINKKNGMPFPFCFPARSAVEIIEHFTNGKVSSYLNIVMAQPIKKKTSSFCLLLYGSDNKFTANSVVKRWKHIETELNKVGISVLTISSDSDPRYNSAMRELASIGENTCIAAEWFSCSQIATAPFCVQDIIHIMTKMRNFILKTMWAAKILPFGNRKIDITHLYVVLYKYSKDKHFLTESVLNPADRQNFSSAQKMCSVKVTDLLVAGVDKAEATALYLQMMRNIMSAFMDPDLTAIQRIRAIWYPLFIIRIWRHYIENNEQYNLKDNFMTMNCYSCVELNAHSLILLMDHLKELNKPELFLPELFGSQQCESAFRQFRSFTSTYSTVTNCTLKEACSRVSKIQMQNEIIQATSNEFIYPRLRKNTECTKTIKFELPSKQEIFAEIEECQKAAIRTAKHFGLIARRNKAKTYVCKLNTLKTKFARVKIIDEATNEREDITYLDLGNIQLKDYTCKLKNTEIDESSPYVVIQNDNGEKIITKKMSLAWLLQKDCPKMSSDRLLRVRHTTRKPYSQSTHNSKQNWKKVNKNIHKRLPHRLQRK